MIERSLAQPIRDALTDTPVVFLHGGRQTGKTTLVRTLVEQGNPPAYLSLDDQQTRDAAIGDPQAFLEQLGQPVVIDEVQLVPELFRAIKRSVDQDRRPGRFLLTGSAHLLVLPELAESLVGRMEILVLGPLSQGEIDGRQELAVDRLFDDTPLPVGEIGHEPLDTLAQRLVRGGFPEAVQRPSSERRQRWFRSYLTTLLQRDVRELANIDGLSTLPNLLRLLAARTGGLSNIAELGRASGLPATTLKRYLALLQGVFVVHRPPAWSANLSKRLVRAPKLMVSDSGILCHLLGADEQKLLGERKQLGAVLEAFVTQELMKQASWSVTQPTFSHYRTHGQEEVDLIMEDAAGNLVGVEVKASSTVGAKESRGLKGLSEALGDRFRRGIVFHTGPTAVPLGKRIHALPVSWLWRS